MGLRVECCNEYELEAKFRSFYEKLAKMTNRRYNVKTGKQGNLMSVPFRKLRVADFLLSGGPCTPWANNGPRTGRKHPAARVTERLIKIVIRLAKRGRLLGFALENTNNILKKINGEPAFIEFVMDRFKSIPFFAISVDTINVNDTCASVRRRTWVRGLRGDVLAALNLHRVPPPLHSLAGKPIKLTEVLRRDLPNVNPATMKVKKGRNILKLIRAIKRDARQGVAGRIAVIDADRSPDNVWGTTVMYDLMPPLRASGPEYFIVSVRDITMPWFARDFCSFLSDEERMEIQGHSADKASMMPTNSMRKRSAGNAFPVQMVAQALLPMMTAIAKSGAFKKRRLALSASAQQKLSADMCNAE